MRAALLITAATWAVPLLLGCPGPLAMGQTPAAWEAARKQMVDQAIVGSGIADPRVVQAMLATPRHEFVPRRERASAYYDMALPIGGEQTISSPYIVAYMTETLDPQPTDKVLEIGTGSGYQAAVLSGLVQEVFTIEIVASLGQRATRTLKRLGYKNVHVKVGDGYAGWPEESPFDKIIVTCSPEKVPPSLVEQLREGGRMIIPVGERYQQTLVLFGKVDGTLQSQTLHPTLFVPMTGRCGIARVTQPNLLTARVVNGDFEQQISQQDQVPGWYYQRQFQSAADGTAPEGQRYGSFSNQLVGRPSLALQGFGIDGQHVGQITVSRLDQAGRGEPRPRKRHVAENCRDFL